MNTALIPYIASKPSKTQCNQIIVPNTSAVIDRFVNASVYVSASLSNIQGDIDNDNAPRVNPCNGHGLMTPQGIKRKIRDLVEEYLGLNIHASRIGTLLEKTKEAVDAKPTMKVEAAALAKHLAGKLKKSKEPKETKGRKTPKAEEVDGSPEAVVQANVEFFYDDRCFGRLFTSPYQTGAKGPVQISMVQTLHPVSVIDLAIGAVTPVDPSLTKTIGRTSVVQYGLYKYDLIVNPVEASKTGMTWDDLNIMLNMISRMWDLTASSSRNGISHEKLFLFAHEGRMGEAPVRDLSRLTTPKLVKGLDPLDPRVSSEDYDFLPLTAENIRKSLPDSIQLLVI